MVAFPFMGLPKPALGVLINQYKPQELVKVALCSKEAETDVKSLYRSQPGTRIILKFYRKTASIGVLFERKEICLFFVTDKNRGQFSREMEIGGVEFPIKRGKFRRMDVYSMDKLGTLKTLSLFVTSIFEIPIHELIVGNHSLDLVTWILERQEKIEDVNILQNMSNSDLEIVLDKLRLSNTLDLGLRPKNDFRYDFGKFPNLLKLTSHHSNWVTIPCLCDMKSVIRIEIKRSSFNNQEANEYLKSWIAGANPKLKEIHFDMEPPQNMDLIMEGIDVPRDRNAYLFFYYGASKRCSFKTHVFLKSVNDREAAIPFSRPMSPRWRIKEFALYVWPDYLDYPFPRDRD
uniref:FBA_2 domain-containing protein n=1 Tax=Caenorhabditis tropicalis TaxID=1561998 RepID=A0A1I7UFK7_9PELO